MTTIAQCNICELPRYCKMFSRVIGGCSSFVAPRSFKMPILTHLLSNKNKVKATSDLLTKFGFKISEIERYPFFRLELER